MSMETQPLHPAERQEGSKEQPAPNFTTKNEVTDRQETSEETAVDNHTRTGEF